LLQFHLVDDTGILSKLNSALADKKMSMTEFMDLKQKGQAAQDLLKLIPDGYEVLPGRESRYVVVKSTPELTGSTLVDAKVELGGQYGYPTVSIEFNPEGTRLFAAATEANVGKNLAIVLDGMVQSAPVIRSAIPDGHAVIEGSFSTEDAK